jgi:PAS domain S-box-containing protein
LQGRPAAAAWFRTRPRTMKTKDEDGGKGQLAAALRELRGRIGDPGVLGREFKRVEGLIEDVLMRLEEEKAKTATVVEAIGDGISVQDTSFRVLLQNRLHREMLGEHTGEYCYRAYQGRDRVCDGCHLAVAFRDGKLHKAEQTREADGELRHYEITASPLRDSSGTIVAGIEAVRDITDRKRAEAELRLSQQLLKKTFVSLRDAVFILTAEGSEIMDCNAAATRMFGYGRKEMLGRTTDFLHVDGASLKEFSARLKAALRQMGYLFLPEFKMRRKDGEVFDTEHSVVPLEDDGGGQIGWISVVGDITEQKRAEEQIRASLKEKEVLLQELYHRTKNNMQVISSLMDLQAAAAGGPILQAFKETQSRIQAMSLVYEKLYQSANLSDVSARDYIEDLARALLKSHGKGAQEISLALEVEDSPLPLDTLTPCGLIVNELMTNSLKYAFPAGGGEIRICLRADGRDWITLDFSDDGAGLPEGFDPRRARSLGLRLVRNLVTRQLGGKMEIGRDGGTRYVMRFKKKAAH